jgi:hypothetical protein
VGVRDIMRRGGSGGVGGGGEVIDVGPGGGGRESRFQKYSARVTLYSCFMFRVSSTCIPNWEVSR